MKISLTFLISIFILGGCAERNFNNGDSVYRPAYSQIAGVESRIDKMTKLNDTDIKLALDYKANYSKYKKISFIPTGNFTSELIGYQGDLIKKYSEKSKVEIARLPSILLSSGINLDDLRQLAARMQVDAVVLFSLVETNRYKYSILSNDKYKSAITIDFYVIDVASGMIPHSSYCDYVIENSQGSIDYELQEKMRREAIFSCMNKMADNLISTFGNK
jgi:hypothetical protein